MSARSAAAAPLSVPNCTADGLWLDPNGELPKFDSDGVLAEPFTWTNHVGYTTTYAAGCSHIDYTHPLWAAIEKALVDERKAAAARGVILDAAAQTAIVDRFVVDAVRRCREVTAPGEATTIATGPFPVVVDTSQETAALDEREEAAQPPTPPSAQPPAPRATGSRRRLQAQQQLGAALRDKGRPEPGKLYNLTGFANDEPSIAKGNTWAESVVDPETLNPVVAAPAVVQEPPPEVRERTTPSRFRTKLEAPAGSEVHLGRDSRNQTMYFVFCGTSRKVARDMPDQATAIGVAAEYGWTIKTGLR